MTLQFNNRKFALALCAIIIVILLLQSCHGGSDECSGKQVTCPSFQDSLAEQWIPYLLNQQIVFTSENVKNDTITFRNVDKTQSHQEKVSASNSNCVASGNWGNSFDIEKNTDSLLHFFVSQSIDQYSNMPSNDISARIRFRWMSIYGYGYSDTGLIRFRTRETITPTDYITFFKENMTLGNKNYSKVQSFEFDTTLVTRKSVFLPQNSIFKFYIAKNIGLIAYQSYPDNKLWVKQ